MSTGSACVHRSVNELDDMVHYLNFQRLCCLVVALMNVYRFPVENVACLIVLDV